MRQGCPLSGLLFVLAIELLGNAIRQSQSIRGIKIGPNEIKLSQYADDTTVFVSDLKSAENLVNLLKLSSECSGLKVNSSKSNVLWLGSERNIQERVISSPDLVLAVRGQKKGGGGGEGRGGNEIWQNTNRNEC